MMCTSINILLKNPSDVSWNCFSANSTKQDWYFSCRVWNELASVGLCFKNSAMTDLPLGFPCNGYLPPVSLIERTLCCLFLNAISLLTSQKCEQGLSTKYCAVLPWWVSLYTTTKSIRLTAPRRFHFHIPYTLVTCLHTNFWNNTSQQQTIFRHRSKNYTFITHHIALSNRKWRYTSACVRWTDQTKTMVQSPLHWQTTQQKPVLGNKNPAIIYLLRHRHYNVHRNKLARLYHIKLFLQSLTNKWTFSHNLIWQLVMLTNARNLFTTPDWQVNILT